MKDFLTDEVTKHRRGRRIALIIFQLLFALVFLELLQDDFPRHDLFNIIFDSMCAALLLRRVVLNILLRRDAFRAVSVAAALSGIPRDVLNEEELNHQLADSKGAQRVRSLMRKGLLRNIRYDAASGTFLLNEAELPEQQKPVPVQCPGCGASGEMIPDRASYCRYCGKLLSDPSAAVRSRKKKN